jgi:hypothetical protein
LPLLLVGMVGVWLACEVAALAGFSQSPAELAYINLIILPHFPIAVAGTFVFFLSVSPRGRELVWLAVAAVGFAGGFKFLDLFGAWQTPVSNCACIGLGFASLLLLAVRVGTSAGDARQQAVSALSTAFLIVGSMPLIFFFLLLTIQLQPTTLDPLAYAADWTLGAPVSFVVGEWFATVPALAMVSGVVYLTLPVAFMVLVGLHLRANGPPVFELLPTFLAVAVVGFCVYNYYPLVGPFATFPTLFPHAAPDIASVLANPPVAPEDPRNGMPSLHTAWALVIFWQARPLGRLVRALAGFYLAFTVFATVGYGAHYAFDLVVAVPSTMACQALCMLVPASARARRWRVVACGVVLTVGWLYLLRFGLPVLAFSPWLTAPAAVLTAVGCVWLEARLYRAARPVVEVAGGVVAPRLEPVEGPSNRLEDRNPCGKAVRPTAIIPEVTSTPERRTSPNSSGRATESPSPA